jgi:hypothetical protein
MAVASAAGLDAVTFEDICEELSRNDSYVRRSELDADNAFGLGRQFEFRHGIHRQVFYDRQGPLRRAGSHEKIALELERLYVSRLDELASRIEEHFTKAGVWSKAIVYNRMSLMTARQRLAYQDALVIFERAKKLVARLPLPDRIGVEIEFLEMEAATSAALGRQSHGKPGRVSCCPTERPSTPLHVWIAPDRLFTDLKRRSPNGAFSRRRRRFTHALEKTLWPQSTRNLGDSSVRAF